MKPVILNPDSHFVVITYWWGRGNSNKNTQRPCPEDVEPGSNKLDKKPMTYDTMIDNWVESCTAANCNYLVVEYPEFAQKGMYQVAINFKPEFILKALDACKPRNVVYIDGDMKILKYPCAFDVDDVDFMAISWNSDVRMCYKCECYDPYVLEISGGTIYFGQGYWARFLLQHWIDEIKKYPKKAEDRVISLLFNNRELLAQTNIIQLPIEYLWLTMAYDESIVDKSFDRKDITIEHPECLTGEDRAGAMGADANRVPESYRDDVTSNIKCVRKSKTKQSYMFERLWFDNNTFHKQKSLLKAIQAEPLPCMPYKAMTQWMRSRKRIVEVIPFEDGFGAERNAIIKRRAEQVVNMEGSSGRVVYLDFNDDRVIPKMLKGLLKHQAVVIGPRPSASDWKHWSKKDLQLICSNVNQRVHNFKASYTLKLDYAKPLVVMNSNKILLYLVAMSENVEDMVHVFNSSFDFISRIRCLWI